MTGLLEFGEIILGASQSRLDVVSRNVSNTSTPGYRTNVSYQATMTGASNARSSAPSVYTDFSQGGLRLTGRPLDLAVSGPGFFMVRSEDRVFYTRDGQFERASDGRVTNEQGYSLQTAEGQDLVLTDAASEILSDGTLLENRLPVARIGLFEPGDSAHLDAVSGTLFAAPENEMRASTSTLVRQGMLETANVDMAGEMVEMMAALRLAEAGARVVQTYDSLIGQAISTFGRVSR